MKIQLLIATCLVLQFYGFVPTCLAQLNPRISSGGGSAPENAQEVSVTVDLRENQATAVSVDYTTKDGTARAGADYMSASGTLTFAPRERQKTVSIPLGKDDGILRGDKTFRFLMSNATGGAVIEANEATVVIEDNEVPVNLDYGFKPASTADPDGNSSGSNYLQAVGENDGFLHVKVRRLGETTGSATVTYRTRDLTAKAGRDYVTTTGTLSFAPLEQEKTITVPILNNTTFESARTLQLFLTNAVGAEFLAPPLTMTIFDDEPGFEPRAIARDAAGTTQISVRPLPRKGFRLEASTDLTTWKTLWFWNEGDMGGSLFKQTFEDPEAAKLPRRFYRLATQ